MKLANWLDNLRKPTKRKRSRQRPSPESLETRTLLTVITEFDAAIGELEVKSDAGDSIVVSSSVDGSDVLVNGGSTGIDPAAVRKLEIKGGPLANNIDISAVTPAVFTSLRSTELKGNAGNDTLVGSDFDDEIKGGSGNDIIDGGAGNDELKGDAGDDSLEGGEGDDSLGGREGDDTLSGGDGDDTLGGGENDDSIRGGSGDDYGRGGTGRDDIVGDGGDDNLVGGDGLDVIDGGTGNDKIAGQDGSDEITGGDGNDKLNGNRGKDMLDGGPGRDRLKGGSSDDLLKGGDGRDSLDGGRGDDLLDGDDGDDRERRGHSVDIESTLFAPMVGVNGKAKFERDVDHDIELEFELQVEDAPAGTYAVDIDGTSIGTITVNSFGNGRLEYSTEPDDPGEQQMPASFPTVAAGSVITIAGLGSGTFAQFTDIELETDLTPINGSGAEGEVEFEADGLERKFQLKVEDISPGTYDLIIDGIVVDTFTVNDDEFEVEWESDEEGSSFPENFPTLDVGSTIEFEGILTGVF